jgi:hypothetical protein
MIEGLFGKNGDVWSEFRLKGEEPLEFDIEKRVLLTKDE